MKKYREDLLRLKPSIFQLNDVLDLCSKGLVERVSSEVTSAASAIVAELSEDCSLNY